MKKEETMLELFFEHPTKQWHFEEIIKAASISRPQAVYWLKKFTKENLIKRTKPRGKMPYYTSKYEHPNYQTKKRLFALTKMEKTGFLKHLTALPKAKTIIIFGSLSRWDWYKESDIDLFIYGDDEGLNTPEYRRKLHRQIQVFTARTKADLKKFSSGLLRNIIEGYRVKGTMEFIEVKNYA